MGAQANKTTISGGLKPAIIVRIVLVALGIASATLLAHSALGIRFNQDFLLFLDIVRDIVGFFVTPFELLIVTPFVRWLNDQGLVFQLYPHWKNAFVLLWLVNASSIRTYVPMFEIRTARQIGAAIWIVVRWVWAALAALIAGTLAGSVPLDHPAVLWWPAAFYFLTIGVDRLILCLQLWQNRVRDDYILINGVIQLAIAAPLAIFALGWLEPPTVAASRPPQFWWPIAGEFVAMTATAASAGRFIGFGPNVLARCALMLTFATVSGALALGVLAGPVLLDFEHTPSPGLANLVAFIALLATWFLTEAFMRTHWDGHSYFSRVFVTSSAKNAMDIFAVLGGAAIIVYLAHLMA